MSRLKMVTGTLAVMMIMAAPALAGSVADGFSAVNNPNEPWGFGRIDGSVFSPYPYRGDASSVGSTCQGWMWVAGMWNEWGHVLKNIGPNPVDEWSAYYEVGKVTIGGASIGVVWNAVRWQASESGYYDIEARFTGQNTDGTNAKAYVIKRSLDGSLAYLNPNDSSGEVIDGFVGRMANNYTDGFGSARAYVYSNNLNLAAGEMIWFATSPYGAFNNEAIGLDASVDLLNAVPEPAGILSLLCGTAGIAALVPRRRCARHK